MFSVRGLVVAATIGLLAASSSVSEGALAKAQGGSGNSGTLSSNKAIRKQQLIADPDSPSFGSSSIQYDPGVVTFSSIEFGPGYTGSALIEISLQGETFLIDSNQYNGQGRETGYMQVFFNEPGVIGITAAAAVNGHGQITPPAGYVTVDNDGPAAVDTHAVFFNYLATVPDTTVAHYKVFSDTGTHNNTPDSFSGIDDSGNFFTVQAADISPAFVSGNLNAVPLPPAALLGGFTMLGSLGIARLRRRTGVNA